MRHCLSLVLTCLIPTLLLAQPGPASSDGPARRFDVTFEGGKTVSGLGKGLAEQFRSAGFSSTRPQTCHLFCSEAKSYPTSTGPGGTTGFAARYWVRPTLAIGAASRSATLGGATGYQAGGYYLRSTWKSNMLSVGVSWMPIPMLRLGVGPVLNSLQNIEGRQSIRKLGVAAELAMENARTKRMLVSLGARFTATPTTDLPTPISTFDHNESGGEVTLRPIWSHLTVLLTIGVRM